MKDANPDEAEIGYAFMSEEHCPNGLVRYAQLAEEAGFTFATILGHYHPRAARRKQPFCLGNHRWHCERRKKVLAWNSCHLSHNSYPSGDYGSSSRHCRCHDARPFFPRSGHRRKPQ